MNKVWFVAYKKKGSIQLLNFFALLVLAMGLKLHMVLLYMALMDCNLQNQRLLPIMQILLGKKMV